VRVFRRGALGEHGAADVPQAAGTSACEGEEIETHERTQGSVGVSGLSDAERDAGDVAQALAGIAALLARPATDRADPVIEDARRMLLSLAEDGGVAAARVLAYLRMTRGPGDGAAVDVPPRLGQWRNWVPPRGNILGWSGSERRMGTVQPRRSDPGE
jgi:hypothetical protein